MPRSILLHVDSSERSAARLRVALQLAEAFDAEVTGLYAVASSVARYPYMLEAAHSVGPLMMQFDQERRERAQAAFLEAAAGSPRARWAVLPDEEAPWGFSRRALYADLLVLGQAPADKDDPSAGDVPADFVPSVVVGSGKPALVVPYIGASRPAGRRVLVAWKESRESARAVAAALPWLQRAEQVHVAAAPESGSGTPTTSADIEAYLQRHGVKPRMHRQFAAGADVGASLLSLAADHDVDLLVMGCYGHSRLREWVLGGATRSVLQSMTVPVLMAH